MSPVARSERFALEVGGNFPHGADSHISALPPRVAFPYLSRVSGSFESPLSAFFIALSMASQKGAGSHLFFMTRLQPSHSEGSIAPQTKIARRLDSRRRATPGTVFPALTGHISDSSDPPCIYFL